MPEVSFDYCFLRDKPGQENVTVLVGRHSQTKMLLAHVVPCKGSTVEWLINQLLRDLRKFGIHGRVILKLDQESALTDLLTKVGQARGLTDQTLIEASPKNESQANGVAEKAVQEIEEAVRTHKLALEARLGSEVSITSAVIPWLVENAADIPNGRSVAMAA